MRAESATGSGRVPSFSASSVVDRARARGTFEMTNAQAYVPRVRFTPGRGDVGYLASA